jgi:hypothetical protein
VISLIPLTSFLVCSIISIYGNTSLITDDIARYSHSVEDNAISPYDFEAHTLEHPANIMMYPILDLLVPASQYASSLFQFPASKASTYIGLHHQYS